MSSPTMLFCLSLFLMAANTEDSILVTFVSTEHSDEKQPVESEVLSLESDFSEPAEPSDQETQETQLTVEVTKQDGEQSPVANAKIIVTYSDGQEFERQTSGSGTAILKGLPFGKVDIDVIATGLNSGGGTELLDQSELTLNYVLSLRHPN